MNGMSLNQGYMTPGNDGMGPTPGGPVTPGGEMYQAEQYLVTGQIIYEIDRQYQDRAMVEFDLTPD